MEKRYSSKSIEQKRLFIFFPFWNMEKAEKILSAQERNGYRLVRLKFGCLFTFQRSTPRKVQYLFTYSFPKDYWPVMEWESTLKSDVYRANVMHRGHNYSIFRVTKDNVNLQDFFVERLRYVQKTLIKKTIIATFFMLSGVFATLLGDFTGFGRLLSIFIFVGGLLETLSYIVGFYSTIQKRKKLIHKHNSI